MNALLDSAQRRRQGLNPLMTSGHPSQLQYPTPVSSVGLSSPFGYQPSPYTPASAVRQYNPQQWGPGGSIAPENTGRYSPSPAGEDGVAFAPPPYSPPRSQRPAGVSPEEPVPTLSPLNRISPANAHRPSPEPGANHVFPPPPGQSGNRTRAQSRDRPQAMFNLGGVFTRKSATTDNPEASSSSSDIREHASSSRRPQPIMIEPEIHQEPEEMMPPAARRAVSTGAIGTPASSRSRGSSVARWEPGMPLPPPPPGPPPQASSRSQSLSRTPEPMVSPPTRRPQAISTLGPVPPTPAGWNDGDVMPRGKSPNTALQIDTSVAASSASGDSSSGHSSSGLARAGAVRGEGKSIRERRSESRSGKHVTVEDPSEQHRVEAVTPSDIVVPPMTVLGRRPTITRSTPRSARSLAIADTPNSSRTVPTDTPALIAPTTESRGSTPRPLNSSRLEASTPPFSPDQSYSYPNSSSSIPPKSLPTPPPQRPRKASSPRPISHILHTPLKDSGMPAPISPVRTSSRPPTSSGSQTANFTQEAIERHTAFAQREAAAATDEERVRIFAEFIVSESRLRRERYATAIDAMGSELLELTRDLFRPYSGSHRNSSGSAAAERLSKATEFRTSRGTRLPALQTDSRSDSTPSSASSIQSQTQGRPESSWWTGYMPSLSPIAASVSVAHDESSSRGRPSSRWWEVGQAASGGGSPTAKVERSKRESKYMGVPREQMESLQWETSGQSSSSQEASSSSRAGPSTQTSYGPDEYPPEKFGLYDDLHPPPSGKTPTRNGFVPYSPALITPNPDHLDVSRLVTLPPPYPRHHPAVNNNHPDLTDIRTSVRSLSDLTEVQSTKESFNVSSQQNKEAASAASTQRRQTLRVSIQRQIEAGTMTYADAAKLEAESTAAEAETSKSASKADFDLFQTSVVAPLNDLLMGRVQHSTELFEQLRSKLFVDAQQQDPNATQEEGDEQPELLEKLTLLKWIFEAREQLHREVYDLLSERNNRYKTMVTAPYRLSGNAEKLRNAERFFVDDAHKRQLEFDERALQRTIEFMDVIETNVVRGVEVQLSAFWDIAPLLRQITERIPRNITREFKIQIPPDEYEENPGYYEHPMQYLYSLLEHGQKSAYQFIESQVNLLCLLHEVKESVVGARCKVVETERLSQGSAAAEDPETVKEDLKRIKETEEQKLTDDLKEKVRCVEELWGSALGTEFEGVKEQVRDFLMDQGGWEGVEE